MACTACVYKLVVNAAPHLVKAKVVQLVKDCQASEAAHGCKCCVSHNHDSLIKAQLGTEVHSVRIKGQLWGTVDLHIMSLLADK